MNNLNWSFSSNRYKQTLLSVELSWLEVEEEQLATITSLEQLIIYIFSELIVDLVIGSVKDMGYWLVINISMASLIPPWKPAQEEHNL